MLHLVQTLEVAELLQELRYLQHYVCMAYVDFLSLC